MKRSADYETDNGAIRVRPNMAWDRESGNYIGDNIAYITIFTSTSKVNINVEQVKEVREILEAIEERYITNKN
jgi:hypothetical protein